MGLVKMGFLLLLARQGGRVRVDVDKALVGLNGHKSRRSEGLGVIPRGLCQFMRPRDLLFPLSYISSLLSPSISFSVPFGYYCVPYRIIVGSLVLFSHILCRLFLRMRICFCSGFVGVFYSRCIKDVHRFCEHKPNSFRGCLHKG